MMSGPLPTIMFSVVPCQFDLTAHQVIPVLNEDWEILD